MAKISISLPDPLKEQLDRYADEHQLSVSETVQRALEALFQPAEPVPPPSPPPSSEPPPERPEDEVERVMLEHMVFAMNQELQEVGRYLNALAHQVEHSRYCLALLAPYAALGGVGLPVPPPLPPRE